MRACAFGSVGFILEGFKCCLIHITLPEFFAVVTWETVLSFLNRKPLPSDIMEIWKCSIRTIHSYTFYDFIFYANRSRAASLHLLQYSNKCKIISLLTPKFQRLPNCTEKKNNINCKSILINRSPDPLWCHKCDLHKISSRFSYWEKLRYLTMHN